MEAYYVPEAHIRLFSPQQYFMQNNGGNLFCDQKRTPLTLHDGGTLEFPHQLNNLPMMSTKSFLDAQQNVAGLSFEECNYLATTQALPSIVDTTNLNLTGSQKELVLWHWKLGHTNMHWVQSLAAVPWRTSLSDPPPKAIIPERPLCTACQLSKQSRRM